MENKFHDPLRQFLKSRSVRVAAFAVLGAIIGSVGMLLYVERVSTGVPADKNISATTSDSSVMEKSLPTRLRIPKVAIDASFEAPLGVMENGEIEVPKGFETVGWYKYGPTPGERGPAVVLGHVDSYEGPKVFYPLRDLEVGDLIYVDRADGTTATFRVTRLETHPQGDFPTEEVYGNIEYAGIRLITCTGRYDRGIRRYSHNLIVFGERINDDKGLSASS